MARQAPTESVGELLASYPVLRTTGVDEARAAVSATLAPHRLRLLGKSLQVLHNAVELDQLAFHYIDYGAEVEVDVEEMGFHLVQVPLAGVTTIGVEHREVLASSTTAAIAGGAAPLRMRYSTGNPRVLVQVGGALLRRRLALATATGVSVPRLHGATIDISRGRGRTWKALLGVVLADLERHQGLVGDPLARGTWEIAVVDALVACLADGSPPSGLQRPPPERVIKRAARIIDDNCAGPLGTPDVAEAVGMSVRSLQAGFRQHLDTTPMAYLRTARLARVRELLRSGSSESVTDAASRCGVTHLGRLSADYRAAFGEAPSDTLRQAH